MKTKIREFAILSPSQALSDMLRRGHFLFTVKGDRCNIFNINFATAKQLAARYGQRPFIFVKMDEPLLIGQRWQKIRQNQPISRQNDYHVVGEETHIIDEYGYDNYLLLYEKFNCKFPLDDLYILHKQFEKIGDNLLTLARERVGIGGLRTRQEVYRDINFNYEGLMPLGYYRYLCEETFFFSWVLSPKILTFQSA